MKIIFLDIDGVLTHEVSNKNENLKDIAHLDEEKIKILKEIVERTNAKIVLHSTWRFYSKKKEEKIYSENYYILVELLKKYRLEIYDHVPIFESKEIITEAISIEDLIAMKPNPELSRASTINEWLKDKQDIESFVIFDDYIDCWENFNYQDNFIHTYYWGDDENKLGLLPKHIKQATDILNKPKVRKR